MLKKVITLILAFIIFSEASKSNEGSDDEESLAVLIADLKLERKLGAIER